jgi:gamma-glutamyltranspeptidase / glutathione hydrolase
MRNFFVPGRSPVMGLDAALASSHPLASAAALEALKDGGNAVDAAVTATFVLCVVEPQSTGIGGDCFALISRKGATPPIAYNGGGRTPRALPRSGLGSPSLGRLEETDVHTVTVPGLVEGLARLLDDHGTFSLKRAMAPAIGYAERGFPVHQKVASEWAGSVWKLKASNARICLTTDGSAPAPGEVFRSDSLARTLRNITKRGPSAFYSGNIAATMVAFLSRHGGYHRLEDFAEHRGAYVEPVSAPYGRWTVWQVPPNGQGVTTLLLLSILEALEFNREEPASFRHHHLLASAAQLALEERDRHIGDPEHGVIDLVRFLEKRYAAQLAARVDAEWRPMAPRRSAGRGDTAYVSVVDRERNAVSLISSLFENFGCGLADPETGVVFHCRGAGFNLTADHPNNIGPAKRPLHTIIPGMVSESGRVVLSFGVTGGHFQPIGQARIINAILDRRLDLQAAIDEPRSFFRDGTLLLEPALAGLSEALAEAGHAVAPANDAIGGAHGVAINWTSGVLTGGSDGRKDGCALAV